MSSEPVLEVVDLSKTYRTWRRPIDRLKQLLHPRGRRYYDEFTAVDGVEFTLQRGEGLGVLGPNGAGKSTLLQMVAGTLAPTRGHCRVNGRIAALLELGSGFNPEFTGRENVFLNGAILGISEEEMRQRYDEIVAFANIGNFIDQPVKTYSSGMFMRLAFSVATSVSPDLLIVDEALGVGDMRFQQRCVTRIRQLQDDGVAIMFVSHDLESVKRVCDRAIVLEHGRMVQSGASSPVSEWYLGRMIDDSREQAANQDADAERSKVPRGMREGVAASSEFRWLRNGDGNAEILRADVVDSSGQPTLVVQLDDEVTFRFDVRFKAAIDSCGFGFYLRDRLGTDVIGVNTFQERQPLGPVAAGDVVRLEFTLPVRVRPGRYGLSPSVAYSQEDLRFMDWVHNAQVLEVVDPAPGHMVFGLYHPPVTTEVQHLERATQPEDITGSTTA